MKLGCAGRSTTPSPSSSSSTSRGRVVGAVVDSVSDVLELASASIKPAPEMSSAVDASYITGIGTVNRLRRRRRHPHAHPRGHRGPHGLGRHGLINERTDPARPPARTPSGGLHDSPVDRGDRRGQTRRLGDRRRPTDTWGLSPSPSNNRRGAGPPADRQRPRRLPAAAGARQRTRPRAMVDAALRARAGWPRIFRTSATQHDAVHKKGPVCLRHPHGRPTGATARTRSSVGKGPDQPEGSASARSRASFAAARSRAAGVEFTPA